MSTFKGIVAEFPDIRIDFFRTIEGVRPPLACFLSHVHSDHLAGLESLKAPFIYCSAATKELLCRLERYPHRMNFAKRILECRKQHFKQLKYLLKPIPLETPTRIELSPGKEIQVTLFDANHCAGAVMFLIEDPDNAILYTGDIRSEPWFVNRLTRSPFLVEYSSGLKTLDCIYLDTSNAGNDLKFPTKAEGLKELIQKVSKYPYNTKFHFAAWTFGYEEVWMMLSRVLNSPVHVDSYRMRLYQSLRGDGGPPLSHEASILAGYKCGNTEQPGILTHDQTVRLHSCEKGTACSTIDEQDVVWIQPIICRKEDAEVAEVGLGGGGKDLTQQPELELDERSIVRLIAFRQKHWQGDEEDGVMEVMQRDLFEALHSRTMSLPLHFTEIEHEKDQISLDQLLIGLGYLPQPLEGKESSEQVNDNEQVSSKILPKTITFPYSRHSSHSELCHLLKAFRPADVYPCTVDEDSWHEGISIEALFGEYCIESNFRHDREMRALQESRNEDREEEDEELAGTQTSRASSEEASTQQPSSNHQHARELLRVMKKTQGSPEMEAVANDKSTKSGEASELGVTPKTAADSIEPAAIATAIDNNPSQIIKALRAMANSRSDAALISLVTRLESHLGDDASPEATTSENNAMDMDQGHLYTPLNLETTAGVTPGSGSQGLRRKAIEDLVQSPAKRNRTSESPSGDSDYSTSDTDKNDYHVHRCSECGWELWTRDGHCTGCGVGEDAYREGFEPVVNVSEGDTTSGTSLNRNRMYSLMEVETDFEIDPAIQAQLKNDFLDFASSAYSDDGKEPDDYEKNSMIDDDPVDSGESEEETDQPNGVSHSAGNDIVDDEGHEGHVRDMEIRTENVELAESSGQIDSDPILSDEVEELAREASEFLGDNIEDFETTRRKLDREAAVPEL